MWNWDGVCGRCSWASEVHKEAEGWERRLVRRHENLEGNCRNPAKTQILHDDASETDKVSHLPCIHVSIKAAEHATLLRVDLPECVCMCGLMHASLCMSRPCV